MKTYEGNYITPFDYSKDTLKELLNNLSPQELINLIGEANKILSAKKRDIYKFNLTGDLNHTMFDTYYSDEDD